MAVKASVHFAQRTTAPPRARRDNRLPRARHDDVDFAAAVGVTARRGICRTCTHYDSDYPADRPTGEPGCCTLVREDLARLKAATRTGGDCTKHNWSVQRHYLAVLRGGPHPRSDRCKLFTGGPDSAAAGRPINPRSTPPQPPIEGPSNAG